MEWLFDPQAWIALATLTTLEIVLGIDNIIFLSILVNRLPEENRPKARQIGLGLAMILRIVLLLGITWVMRLEAALFTIFEEAISGRDLILIAGGLFLLAKSTREIHHKLEEDPANAHVGRASSFGAVLVQIALLDLVFSLDSVITAVGMADHVPVMVIAVVIAVGVMMLFAGPVSRFVDRHPTVQMLALAFLLLVGVMLVADGLDLHIPRGYIYFAMGFSVFVELLNLRAKARRQRRKAGG